MSNSTSSTFGSNNPHFVSNTSPPYRHSGSIFSSATGQRNKTDYRRAISNDMAHKSFLISPDHFVSTWMPVEDTAILPPMPDENPFVDLEDANDWEESEVVKKVAAAINREDLVPGLQMATSETKYDLDANGKQKIDGALYLDQYTPEDGRPHWPDQVVPIEFKRGRNSLDPFDDKKDGGTTQAETRKVVRGQVANYVETLLDYQYRTFTFFLFFFGRTVRLTRWSRAGVIVSHAFDYVDKWDTLCEALRRISHLTRVDSGQGVGYDPTSTRLRSKDPEWKVMTNAAKARSTDVDLTERDLADGELVGAFTFKYVRDMFAESLQQDAARYKLAIPDGNGGFRYFLVARRQFRGPGAIGRGTCGLVGYEKKTRRFYWIKDTWRADYPALMREGDVLEELRLAGVPNIPTLVCHGDLPGQATVEHTLWKKRQVDIIHTYFSAPTHDETAATIPFTFHMRTASSSLSATNTTRSATSAGSSLGKRKRSEDEEDNDSYADDGGSNADDDGSNAESEDVDAEDRDPDIEEGGPDVDPTCPFRRHQHYRLCVEEVGLPLHRFTSVYQFLNIVLNAVQAHSVAFRKCDILHRDVSGGNILIFPRVVVDKPDGGSETRRLLWKGALIDWELAKKITEKFWRQPGRTGTMQFMSIAILMDGNKVATVSDDMESFFYIILYYSVRYVDSNITEDAQVFSWLERFFDCYTLDGDIYTCGEVKKSASWALSGQLTLTGSRTTLAFPAPLNEVLHSLHLSLKCWYLAQRWEEEQLEHAREAKKSPGPGMTPPPPAAPIRYSVPSSLTTRKHAFDADMAFDIPQPEGSLPSEISEPTTDQYNRAKAFMDARAFYGMVYQHLADEAAWHELDTPARDRVPPGIQSTVQLGPAVTMLPTPVSHFVSAPAPIGAEPSARGKERALEGEEPTEFREYLEGPRDIWNDLRKHRNAVKQAEAGQNAQKKTKSTKGKKNKAKKARYSLPSPPPATPDKSRHTC